MKKNYKFNNNYPFTLYHSKFKNTVLPKTSSFKPGAYYGNLGRTIDLYKLTIPKKDEWTISASFPGHDASVTIAKGEQILETIEVEKFLNVKHIDWSSRKKWNDVSKSYVNVTEDLMYEYLMLIKKYISRKYTDVFDVGLYVDRPDFILDYRANFTSQDYLADLGMSSVVTLKKVFNVKNDNWHLCSHHGSHAASTFYQSPYTKAIVITFDGGSPDGAFNFFLFDRNKPPEILASCNLSITKEYHKTSMLIDELKFDPYISSFSNPGKMMGMVGYGKVNYELLFLFKKLFYNDKRFEIKSKFDHSKCPHLKFYHELVETPLTKRMTIISSTSFLSYSVLLDALGLDPYTYFPLIDNTWGEWITIGSTDERIRYAATIERLKGKQAYDLAATIQKAFEEVFIEIVMPVLNHFDPYPVCLSGGGALNILNNTNFKQKTYRNVFVCPDPADTGLSLGAMLNYLAPKTPYDNPYTGPHLLDLDTFGYFLYDKIGLSSKHTKYIVTSDIDKNLSKLAKYICCGAIIGVARGRSERGARALGNRSIICSATMDGMKDRINSRVKFREWFRPFAPIVKLESVDKYFDWEGESRYMNFCPDVKTRHARKLKAITHVDDTARVQTITKKQNEFMYNLLDEVENLTGYDVLLNTSFNVNKKPIINTINDAFKILEKTNLDGIVIENTLIIKKSFVKTLHAGPT